MYTQVANKLSIYANLGIVQSKVNEMYKYYFNETLKHTETLNQSIMLNENISIHIMDVINLNVETLDLSSLLTENELIIVNRRKFNTAKQEYIASRFIIKKALSQLLKCALTQIETRFNDKVSRLEAFYQNQLINASISISHSKGVVAVAISNITSLFGLDIEKISLKRPFVKLAEHFYHNEEVKLIKNEPKPELIFYRIWTLKEALAKTLCLPIAQLLSTNVFENIADNNLYSLSGQWQGFDISLISKNKLDKVNVINLDIKLLHF